MTKIELFNRMKPARFRFIIRFLVERLAKPGYGILFNVEASLAENLDSGAAQLNVKFIECADLRFGDMNQTRAALLTVYDISDRGLESLAYRIVDEEASYFSLNCRDFEFDVKNVM